MELRKMNFDICKKCNKWICIRKNNSDYKMFCMKLPATENDILEHMKNETYIDDESFNFIKNNSICRKIVPYEMIPINYVCKFEDKEYNDNLKENLKKLEIMNSCPYYIEHQMSDWNKNEF